jgi:hypothetical protein
VKSGKHGTRTPSCISIFSPLSFFLSTSTAATYIFWRNSEMHHSLCWTEFHPVLTPLSFFLSASTAATYIFTAPTCTTTIITSNERCALNAEFQHYIPRFNKISLTLRTSLREGTGGERRPKDRVTRKTLWKLSVKSGD